MRPQGPWKVTSRSPGEKKVPPHPQGVSRTRGKEPGTRGEKGPGPGGKGPGAWGKKKDKVPHPPTPRRGAAPGRAPGGSGAGPSPPWRGADPRPGGRGASRGERLRATPPGGHGAGRGGVGGLWGRPRGTAGGGSRKRRHNLSGSRRRGRSAAYSTPFRFGSSTGDLGARRGTPVTDAPPPPSASGGGREARAALGPRAYRGAPGRRGGARLRRGFRLRGVQP